MKTIDRIIERLDALHSKAIEDYLEEVADEIKEEISYLERLKEPTEKMEWTLAECMDQEYQKSPLVQHFTKCTMRAMLEAAEEQE